MAVFTYKALDIRDGNALTTGTIVADTPRQARDQLRARGLTIQQLGPLDGAVAGRDGWLRRILGNNTTHASAVHADGMSATDAGSLGSDAHAHLRHFRGFRGRHFRGRGGTSGGVVGLVLELSTLLAVGVPLLEALETAGRQHRGQFRVRVEVLRDRVAQGASLAQAMREQSDLFDEMTVSIVEVGEHTGQLETLLEQLADFMQRSMRFKNRIVTVLLYPAIVLTTGIGVCLFLMTFVVPNLLSALVEAGKPLPLPTLVVKAMSDFLLGWWGALLVVLGAAVVGVAAIVRTARGRRWWDRMILRLPVIGDLARKQALSRLSVVIATLMRSGIPFVQAIQIAQRSARNVILREALVRCERAIHAGQDISQAFEDTGAFDPVVVQVFSIGQHSGRLEDMLDRLSADYERQLDVTTQRLTAVMEPLLILLLAVIVGFIAFATVMPILEAGNVL